MNANGILRKHWVHVGFHFAADSILFSIAVGIGFVVRFGNEAPGPLWHYAPFVVAASWALSATIYVTGLYSKHSAGEGHYRRAAVLSVALLLAFAFLIAATYFTYFHPIGRGIILIGAPLAYGLALAHHTLLLRFLRTHWEQALFVLTNESDESNLEALKNFRHWNVKLSGVVTATGYRPKFACDTLGCLENLPEIVRREAIDRVIYAGNANLDPALSTQLCKLRFSGVVVVPLAILYEEMGQYVPVDLVTREWLLNASGQPQFLYVKKVKRFCDIVGSSLGLLLSVPVLAVAGAAIKMTSPGSILYRQIRSGRFGRPITVTKLRTMHLDAENSGPQWSKADDPRIHAVGRFLRKYRIDELPQLWEVLKGDMSFVGPRPERPEITAQLAKEIPFFEARLLVQPGVTGWAQVNYPYGASTADARHKLEYDLYYIKHTSCTLDGFILLDTVRTILAGGARRSFTRPFPDTEKTGVEPTAFASTDPLHV